MSAQNEAPLDLFETLTVGDVRAISAAVDDFLREPCSCCDQAHFASDEIVMVMLDTLRNRVRDRGILANLDYRAARKGIEEKLHRRPEDYNARKKT